MFKYALRVFIEDTDAGGIVYHANYLKYAERARTTLLSELCPDFLLKMKEKGIIFVVHHAEIEYKRPAFLGDQLLVDLEVESSTGASMNFTQHVVKDDQVLVKLRIKIVCIEKNGKVVRLPPFLKELIDKLKEDRKKYGSRSIATD